MVMFYLLKIVTKTQLLGNRFFQTIPFFLKGCRKMLYLGKDYQSLSKFKFLDYISATILCRKASNECNVLYSSHCDLCSPSKKDSDKIETISIGFEINQNVQSMHIGTQYSTAWKQRAGSQSK